MEIQDRLTHMGVSPKHGRVALALQAHMLAVRPEIATFVCLNLICYVKIKWKGKKNDAKFTGLYAYRVSQFVGVFWRPFLAVLGP